MSSAILVGDYVVASGEGRYTPMQVLKLAYIGHGFSLAINEKPLFHDRIEAWKYGPVIPNLYRIISKYKGDPIPRMYICNSPVGSAVATERKRHLGDMLDENKKVLDDVLDGYGKYDGLELSDITHAKGSPWDYCFDPNDLNKEIPNKVIKEYYMAKLKRNKA